MISPKDMKRILNSPYRLLPVAERYLLENNAEKTMERDKLHLHPSEICKKDWCPRQSYYRIIGLPEPEESFTLQRLNVFAEGHLIHQKWQEWLTKAGVLSQSEVPIFNKEHRIMGHADGIVTDKQGTAVLEIKSVGVGTVRFEDYGLFAPYAKKEITLEQLWASIKHPFDSHVRQLQLYMYCLGIEHGIILYEWKATQEAKEFSVEYQPELIAPILASCMSVQSSLDEEIPPSRPLWLSPDHRVCKNCPFKAECWRNENSSDRQQGSDSGSGWGTDRGRDEEVLFQVPVTRQADGADSRDARQPRRVVR
jgi:CRISPR/Cas system-associated exonuclease Cas4 (RecB family)